MEEALLIEPYGCSKHAVDRAGITNEDVVVISGAGTPASVRQGLTIIR